MAYIDGICDERFIGVREALAASIDGGSEVGASVSIYFGGNLLVDIWGGTVDEARTTLWRRDTIINTWSLTKTMTSLCALMLADRGELDFHAPVARYWPEFAAAGKEGVEVRHVLGHTAGLAGWTEPLEPEDLTDWEKCVSLLANQAPWWTPGTVSGYHSVTHGYLIGEIARRITGVSIGEWFASEVAKPLGADFHIGVPESEDRRIAPVIPPAELDFGGAGPDSMTARVFRNPPIDVSMANETWWRRAEIPSANGHGNARSVALAQSVIAGRGETGGIRLLSASGCDPIFEEQANGPDLVIGVPVRFGMGYGLSTELTPVGPRACYWGGFGGSAIVIDQQTNMTVSYVMNKMVGTLTGDERGGKIIIAAYEGAAKAGAV